MKPTKDTPTFMNRHEEHSSSVKITGFKQELEVLRNAHETCFKSTAPICMHL
jgi:hypothetical protein